MARKRNTQKTAPKNTPATANTTAEAAETEETEQKPSNSIVPPKFKEQYKAHGNSCGDELSQVLSEAVKDDKGKVDVTKLETVMKQNGIETSKWSGQNVGQRRMNLGNVLRARLKKSEFVQVGDKIWNKSAKQAA